MELETGQVRWSYDVRPESELTSVVIPPAVGTDGQTAYTGVQSPYKDTTVNFVEIHAVNVATGEPVWQQPARLEPATASLIRPVVLGGVLYAGVEGLSPAAWPGVTRPAGPCRSSSSPSRSRKGRRSS